MLFEFNAYSALLLIIFCHLIVFSLLIFKKSYQQESKADILLSILLILAALYISPWMLGFAGWYDNQPYRDVLFYTPFVHGLLMGPITYFYVKQQLHGESNWQTKDILHFVPGILWILFHIVMVITDKLILGKYYFLESQSDPDFNYWYQAATIISTSIYLYLSYQYYNAYQLAIDEVISFADTVRYRWIKVFLISYALYIALTISFEIIGSMGIHLDYAGSWWYFMCFGLVFYYVSIEGFAAIRYEKFELTIPIIDQEMILNTTSPLQTIDDLDKWKEKVLMIITTEQGYTNPELSLPDLAKHLKTNASVLSKVINQGFGMSFNDFVNEQRVKAVIHKPNAGEHQHLTLIAIAFDCGFNSKATFNRAFKKVTGASPKEYRP